MEEEDNEAEMEERLYAMLHHLDQSAPPPFPSAPDPPPRPSQPSSLPRYWRTKEHAPKQNQNTNPFSKHNQIGNKQNQIGATTKQNQSETSSKQQVNVSSTKHNQTGLSNTKQDQTNNPYSKHNQTSGTKQNNNVNSLKQQIIVSSKQNQTSVASKQDQTSQSIIKQDQTVCTKKEAEPIPNTAPVLPPLINTRAVRTSVHILDEPAELPPVCIDSSSDDDVVEVALPPKPTFTVESSDEDEVKVISPITAVQPPRFTSPAPSVQSSVSDEFIRGDCIALNISSKHGDSHRFDFSLHGSDLLPQPSKKRKKRKSKSLETTPADVSPESSDSLFATPKSKSKNKKAKLTPKVIVPHEIEDSDSNMSANDAINKQYAVTAVSLPHADVYESDSSHSEMTPRRGGGVDCVTSSEPEIIDVSEDIVMANVTAETDIIDFTEDLVIANVTFAEIDLTEPIEELEGVGSDRGAGLEPQLVAPKGLTLEAVNKHMRQYYDCSWGGDNFCHRALQAVMPRDRNLWAIDSRDMMPTPRRKPICEHCGRGGHRESQCRRRPVICHMCGKPGHRHTHCNTKLCFTCGSAARVWARRCGRCATWSGTTCSTCSKRGHPAHSCPDLWKLRDLQLEPLKAKEPPIQDHHISGSGDITIEPFNKNQTPSTPSKNHSPLPVLAKQPFNKNQTPSIPSRNLLPLPAPAKQPLPPPEEEFAPIQVAPAPELPRNRNMMLRLLNDKLGEMDQETTAPKALHQILKKQQRTHRRLMNQKNISSVKLGHSRRRIEIAARKLNAALAKRGETAGKELGLLRAGVAKVQALRRPQVPEPLRKELSSLYRTVFSAAPRDDYAVLLQPGQGFPARRFNAEAMNFAAKRTLPPPFVSFPAKRLNAGPMNFPAKGPFLPTPLMSLTAASPAPLPALPAPSPVPQAPACPVIPDPASALLKWQKLVQAVQPTNDSLKKTRDKLMRQINYSMNTVRKRRKLNSKLVKKVRKIQAQADNFLKTV